MKKHLIIAVLALVLTSASGLQARCSSFGASFGMGLLGGFVGSSLVRAFSCPRPVVYTRVYRPVRYVRPVYVQPCTYVEYCY